jgi:hypothetical protein
MIRSGFRLVTIANDSGLLAKAARQFSELSWEQAVVEELWQPQAKVATHLAGEARSVAALR